MSGIPETQMCEDVHIVNPIISTDPRRCTKCGKAKVPSEFYNDKHKKDGLRSWCKRCVINASMVSQNRNREKRRTYLKKWREDNKEKTLGYWEKRKTNHKEELREYEKIRCKSEKRKKGVREWNKNNPERKREHTVKARKKYYRTPKGKIHQAMKKGICRLLERGNKKNRSWESLVGYTSAQLITHLEKQFYNNMTWGNHGKYWEIDHIIPVSVFNFTKTEHIDFKRCWALKNLRPLEKSANRKKSCKLSQTFQPSLAL